MAPRKTIDEWLLAVKVGKKVRYSVLEGTTDRAIVQSLVEHADNAEIVTADSIEIPLDGDPNPLLGGNKARLWKLAGHIAARALPNAVCHVDRDFEPLYSCLPRETTLVFTDFANLPSGFCDFPFVSGFLRRAHNIEISAANWNIFCQIFITLFAFRFFKASTNPTAPMPDAGNSFSAPGGIPTMDWGNFFTRAIVGGGFGITPVQLASEVNAVAGLLVGDFRHFIHSEDLFTLVFVYLRKLRRIPNTATKETVRSSMIGAMGVRRPGQDNLSRLTEWLSWQRSAPQ